MPQPPLPRAFTVIETVIAIAIVGGLLAASLSAVGGIARVRLLATERRQGLKLAEDMLREIAATVYEDPVGGMGSFGLGASESAGPGRTLYNDVDDYTGLVENGCKDRDGVAVPDVFSGWTRTVTIKWVLPTSPDTASNTDTRLKRIWVTMTRRNRTVVELTALRSAACDSEWR